MVDERLTGWRETDRLPALGPEEARIYPDVYWVTYAFQVDGLPYEVFGLRWFEGFRQGDFLCGQACFYLTQLQLVMEGRKGNISPSEARYAQVKQLIGHRLKLVDQILQLPPKAKQP